MKRIWLFVTIVWRYDMTGFRMSWGTAWEVSRIIHGS